MAYEGLNKANPKLGVFGQKLEGSTRRYIVACITNIRESKQHQNSNTVFFIYE